MREEDEGQERMMVTVSVLGTRELEASDDDPGYEGGRGDSLYWGGAEPTRKGKLSLEELDIMTISSDLRDWCQWTTLIFFPASDPRGGPSPHTGHTHIPARDTERNSSHKICQVSNRSMA